MTLFRIFNLISMVMLYIDYTINRIQVVLLHNVGSDIPQKTVDLYVIGSLIKGRIELQALELTVNDEKWLVINMYKDPKTPDATFLTTLINCYQLIAPNILMLFYVVILM